MIPKPLITQLNSGRCFVLIGSGPSTAMGYPSWTKLAEQAVALLPKVGLKGGTHELVSHLMDEWRLPELFDVVADNIGGMHELVNQLRPLLVSRDATGAAYEYLAKWPFRCYLTTNYDDAIEQHLRRLHENYAILNNSQPDLAQIDAHTTERIVKLHGDFDFTDGLVLGQRQYQDFKVGNRSYFREKLKSIFSMVPVLVVGHSLTDPHIALILEQAKELNAFDRPIYMIMADVKAADSRKYREEFNIELLSYDNSDKTHSQLIRLLKLIDRFVIPRTQCASPLLDPPDPNESRLASSLYLFSKGKPHHDRLVTQALSPQVLAISASDADREISFEQIRDCVIPEVLKQDGALQEQLNASVEQLFDLGLVTRTETGVTITPTGLEHFNKVVRSREILESQVYDLLQAKLQETAPGAADEIEMLVSGLRNTIAAVFRQRGLAASSMLFGNSSLDPSDMPELFETIMNSAARVATPELRMVFSEFVMDLLTYPNETQREYIANISQGYFAFHMFGADPDGADVRKKIAQETLWICDSNLLVPLIASECSLSAFSSGLLSQLQHLGINTITTGYFVSETLGHFRWAKNNFNGNGGVTRGEMLGMIRDPNYSGNLFVDGYIAGAAKNKWRSFDEFVEAIGVETIDDLETKLDNLGIRRMDLSQFVGYSDSVLADREQLVAEIIDRRTRQNTLRGGRDQATAEAEALLIIRGIRKGGLSVDGQGYRNAYFLSTSRLLDIMYRGVDGLITWFPDNLFRHLQVLCPQSLDVPRAFDAITSNYYRLGVEVVDQPAYRKFFDPVINEASVTLRREKEHYEAAVAANVHDQQKAAERLEDQFENTPDLDKPRLVAQAGWFVARQETEYRRAAEARAKSAELDKARTISETKQKIGEMEAEFERKRRETAKHEAGRIRNLQNPKHQSKLEKQRNRRNKNKKGGKRGGK